MPEVVQRLFCVHFLPLTGASGVDSRTRRLALTGFA